MVMSQTDLKQIFHLQREIRYMVGTSLQYYPHNFRSPTMHTFQAFIFGRRGFLCVKASVGRDMLLPISLIYFMVRSVYFSSLVRDHDLLIAASSKFVADTDWPTSVHASVSTTLWYMLTRKSRIIDRR